MPHLETPAAVTARTGRPPLSCEALWRYLQKNDSPVPFYLAGALGCLPIFAAAWLICTSCANVASNDYAELMPRIGHMIEPNYDWSHFARDSSMSSHCLFFPMLVHLANIACFHWNVPLECYIGLGLCLVKVLLLDRMLNLRQFPAAPGSPVQAGEAHGASGETPASTGGSQRSVLNSIVLMTLLGLSFGAANCSVYLYNLTAIAYGITFLFLVLGFYCLDRFGKTSRGFLGMLLCGIVTSFSNGGSAMFSWVTFALYILIAPGKNRLAGLGTCAAGLTLAFGSICWLVRSGGIASATLKPHLPDPRMYLQCFALPFLKDTTMPVPYTHAGIAIGAAAWLLALVLVALVIKRRLFTKPVALSAALMAFAMLNLFAASAFRAYTAPWYDSFATLFWAGILGLALSVTGAASNIKGEESKRAKLNLSLTALPLALIFVLFLCTNLSCRDKDSFRDGHAPASEAVMRHYSTCPTYAEANLFDFTIGHYPRIAALCEVPARHGLCCYNGPQTILLQGDYVLPEVRAILPSEQAQIAWISGTNLRKDHDWREPEHLNLALGGGASLVWPLDVPHQSSQCTFSTSCRISQIKKRDTKAADLLEGAVTITDRETGAVQQKTLRVNQFWSPLSIDLQQYRGHRIEIAISGPCENRTGAAGISRACIVFQTPTVRLGTCPSPAADLAENPSAPPAPSKPSNTELSANFRPPVSDDFILSQDEKIWDRDGLVKTGMGSGGETLYKASKANSSLTYKPGLGLSRRQLDRFYIEVSVPEKIKPRAVCCQLVVNGSLRSIFIPLLADGGMHRYTYDLKLTDLSANDQIVAFKVLPLFTADPGPDCVIGIGKIGFLKP